MNYRVPFFTLFAAVFSIIAVTPVFSQTTSSVYNIHAEEESSTSIKITWEYKDNASDSGQAFELYKAATPFSATYEIKPDTKIADLPITSRDFSDAVNDYHEYYYAILVRTKDGTDRIILPSMNATVTGAHKKFPEQKVQAKASASAEEKIYPEGTLRKTPLPTLNLLETDKINEHPLKNETIRKGAALADKKPDYMVMLEPYAFEQDLISPEGGEDYLLFDTLHKTFARKLYKEGIEQLEDFLSVNHSEEISKRTYFYLGECQYFSGLYSEAVMSFLKVHEDYPDLTQKWIDSSLNLISVSDIAD